MSFTSLTLADIATLEFETVDELPPYNEYLPGPPATLAPVTSGEEGAAGAVSIVRLVEGGIRFIEMPISSLSTIIDGQLAVTDADGTRTFSPGEAFVTPPNWSGEIRVVDPVVMLLAII